MRSVPREMGMPWYCDDPESIGDSAQHGLLGIALCDSCAGLRIGDSGNWRVVMEPSCGRTMAAIESLSLSNRRKISIVAMLVELLLWCWHRPLVVGQSSVLSALDLWMEQLPSNWTSSTYDVDDDEQDEAGEAVKHWEWSIKWMEDGEQWSWYWRCPRESRRVPQSWGVKPVVNFIQSLSKPSWGRNLVGEMARNGRRQLRNGGKVRGH